MLLFLRSAATSDLWFKGPRPETTRYHRPGSPPSVSFIGLSITPPRRCKAGISDMARKSKGSKRRILVIDVGGTHIKFEVSGQRERREFNSGPRMTAKRMVSEVKRLTKG